MLEFICRKTVDQLDDDVFKTADRKAVNDVDNVLAVSHGRLSSFIECEIYFRCFYHWGKNS